jgi:ribosomal protein L7Ae-like RNA K-turn-binding protein
MMSDKFFSYLGLAMRAGKLISGDEIVLKAIRNGDAKLVCIAEDASDNTTKKFQDKCRSYEVPIVQFGSRGQIGHSIGKAERVVIAVTDHGLAKMIETAKS